MFTINHTEFRREHLAGLVPVLITDGLAGGPAMERWSPDSFVNVPADVLVDVSISRTGLFQFDPDGSPTSTNDQRILNNVRLRDASADIARDDSSDPKYYVYLKDVGSVLPELMSDLRFPPVEDSGTVNLWFGSSGTVTQLHYDGFNNCYAQIRGRKKFTIYSPDQAPYLYPYPVSSKVAHLSYVDVEQPFWDRYPLFRKAEPEVFTMHPGQLLFLPAFWWHHVRSDGVSISVNQWWTPQGTITAFSPIPLPISQDSLFEEYRRDRWVRVCMEYKLSMHGLLYAAKTLVDRNPSLAVLAADVALQQWEVSHGTAATPIRLELKPVVDAVVKGNQPVSHEVMPLIDTIHHLVTAADVTQ